MVGTIFVSQQKTPVEHDETLFGHLYNFTF